MQALDEATQRFVQEKTALKRWSASTARECERFLCSLWESADVTQVGHLPLVFERWDELMAGFTPGTRSVRAAKVSQFGRWCCEQGWLAPATLDQLPKSTSIKPTRARESFDVDAVLAATTDQRERLVCALMAYAGLRTVEVQRLRWRDVQFDSGTLLVRGKGENERIVDMHEAEPYLRMATGARPDDQVAGSRRRFGARVNVDVIRNDVIRAFARSGVAATPHALRREFGRRQAERGVSLDRISRMYGHSRIETLDSYLPSIFGDLHDVVEGRGYDTDEPWDQLGEVAARLPTPNLQWGRKRLVHVDRASPQPSQRGQRLALQVRVDEYVAIRQDRWGAAHASITRKRLRLFAREAPPLTREGIHDWMGAKEWSKNTIANQLVALRPFFDYLVRCGDVVESPLRNTRGPRIPRTLPRVLTAAECERVLNARVSAKTKLMLTLVLEQAMSPGELSALQVQDIDLLEATVRRPNAVVPLTAVAHEALTFHLRGDPRTTGFLFVNRGSGGPMKANSIANSIFKAFRNADVSGNATILRRTAAAAFANSGAPIHVVRDLAGYRTIESTQNYIREDTQTPKTQAWPLCEPNGTPASLIDLRAASVVVGVTPGQLRNLIATIGLQPDQRFGMPLLTADQLRTIVDYRINHRRSAHRVPSNVADLIVSLRDDDRSFVWIAKRLNRDGISAGNRDAWTPTLVNNIYKGRKR